MGLFSSEYRTTVGTTVSRVVEDKLIVPSLKVGLISGLLSQDSDQLVENVMESLVSGIGIRAERMYAYAKRSYTYGLPSSKVSTSGDNKSVVIGLLKSLYGQTLLEKYYHIGPINNLHIGWNILCTVYGYDSATNELNTLSSQKGYPVYLKDLIVVIKEATLSERENGSLDQWGIAAKAGYTPERPVNNATLFDIVTPTPIRVDPNGIEDSVLLQYVWKSANNVVNNEEILIPILGFDREKDYFQVKYTINNKDNYWIYKSGTGTYPEIDALFDMTINNNGEFFPVIYFRQGTYNMGSNTQDPGYITSNKMMKLLGIDYQAIINGVHQSPNISQVEQAMMVFAVPPKTENQVEQRYLFDFFSKMYLAARGIGVGVGWDIGDVGSGTTGGDDAIALTAVELAIKKIDGFNAASRIRINIQDQRLSTALSCQGIFKKKKTGVISAVGKYTSSFETENVTYAYTKREITGYINTHDDQEPVYSDVAYTYQVPMDLFKYKHQISDTVYEEISVYDLKMTYYMWGGYSTVGDNLDAILRVPLDHSITSKYSVPDREELYTLAMHYVFNSRVVTEVAWYQQGWFSDLITAGGIIITVVSLGADGGTVSTLAASIAASTGINAAIVMIALNIGAQILISEAFKLFVDIVGTDVAFLAAIVAAAYGGYKAFEAGSIKGAPWAQSLLEASSNLSTAISSSVQDAMNGLSEEADAFNLLLKEKTELLEKESKLLDRSNVLAASIRFGETSDQFYNRTIHSGNIGMLGIDSISSYVSTALTLPKINDTLEGYKYA